MKIKNCIIDKFSSKRPDKNDEAITTITFQACNLSNKEVGEISNYLGREIDLEIDPAVGTKEGHLPLFQGEAKK